LANAVAVAVAAAPEPVETADAVEDEAPPAPDA
jgi:hypothetical protein